MRAPLAALALGLGILVVIQSEVRFNLANYGSLSSMQESSSTSAGKNHDRPSPYGKHGQLAQDNL